MWNISQYLCINNHLCKNNAGLIQKREKISLSVSYKTNYFLWKNRYKKKIKNMETQKLLGPRSSTSERVRTHILLGDFVAEGSKGLAFLQKIYPYPLSRSVLISLATIFSGLIDVPFDRDIKRKKELIIKWFDENLVACSQWETHVRLDFTEYREYIDKDLKKKKKKNKLPKSWDTDEYIMED